MGLSAGRICESALVSLTVYHLLDEPFVDVILHAQHLPDDRHDVDPSQIALPIFMHSEFPSSLQSLEEAVQVLLVEQVVSLRPNRQYS